MIRDNLPYIVISSCRWVTLLVIFPAAVISHYCVDDYNIFVVLGATYTFLSLVYVATYFSTRHHAPEAWDLGLGDGLEEVFRRSLDHLSANAVGFIVILVNQCWQWR